MICSSRPRWGGESQLSLGLDREGATLADDDKDVIAEKAPDTLQYPREGTSKDY